MARPPRLQVAGGVFHVTARGSRQAAIFLDDQDRERFLDLLRTVRRRFGWSWLAYCLMNNHYHLLVCTPGEDLAKGMWLLNGDYATGFNRRHGLRGHVFEGRYVSVPVQDDEQLVHTVRYIARNPVEAGLCRWPGDWVWSSHGAVLGRGGEEADGLVDVRAVLGRFGAWGGDARRRYAEFVDDWAGSGRAPLRSAVMPKRRSDARPVYSTTDGDLRKARDPQVRARLEGGGRVKVRRETSGRRGKAVTTVANVPLDDDGLRDLAGRLKKRCGVGGAVKDGVIELQGDHRDAVVEVLRGEGYDVVIAGG
ncbi:MAG: transposase [Solirubrobacterales bacterium]|nr:transposase [Solirubrobacterales bacterium]